MTILDNENDIQRIKGSGEVIKEAFRWIEGNIRSGISTQYLDEEIERIILEKDGMPAFKGYKGYPSTICASVNHVVVHGIPSRDIILHDGDIVSIDIGVKKNGFFTDAAKTFAVGDISDEAKRLISVTKESLEQGIKEAVEGNRVSDISHAVEKYVRRSGFKEVRAFVGHGIGYKLHEPPEIPNWGEKGKGELLREGLLLAIEPMVNIGTREIKILDDGWTAVTKDGKLSAHFEHTVIVGKEKAEALT